jgi:hypothetical protein
LRRVYSRTEAHASTAGAASIFDIVSGSFLEFAELCDALAATTKKLEKRALISDWLRTLSVEDAALGSLIWRGRLLPRPIRVC